MVRHLSGNMLSFVVKQVGEASCVELVYVSEVPVGEEKGMTDGCPALHRCGSRRKRAIASLRCPIGTRRFLRSCWDDKVP